MNIERRQSSRDQSGFTLVELMVAITILAMVMGAVTGTVSVSTKMASNILERSHSVDRQIQIRSFLRRELQQAMTTPVTEDNGRKHVAFSGLPQSISFVAPLPESASIGGLHRLTLQVEEHEDSESLVLLHEPFLPQLRPGAGQDDVSREVLLEGMESIEFSYIRDDSPSSRWSGNWDDPARLPALIQIRFGSRDRDAWPNFVVAPRIHSQQSSTSLRSNQ
jgi:general secretion pathway protein J